MRGEIPRLEVDLTGSAEIRAKDLVARDVVLDGTGSSRAFVCATSKLDVELSGSSRAVYFCDPRTVEEDVSGSSRLEYEL